MYCKNKFCECENYAQCFDCGERIRDISNCRREPVKTVFIKTSMKINNHHDEHEIIFSWSLKESGFLKTYGTMTNHPIYYNPINKSPVWFDSKPNWLTSFDTPDRLSFDHSHDIYNKYRNVHDLYFADRILLSVYNISKDLELFLKEVYDTTDDVVFKFKSFINAHSNFENIDELLKSLISYDKLYPGVVVGNFFKLKEDYRLVI